MLPVAYHPKRNARPSGLSRLKSGDFKENPLSYPQNMGAFLSIGLVNEVSVGCDTMAIEEVKIPLAERGIHLNIYEGKIKEGSWEGKLRPGILEKELLPFLRALYDSMGRF